MWHSTHSTGVKQFDDDHQKIDALLRKIAKASNPVIEHELLENMFSALETHINNKKKLTEFEYLPDAKVRDNLLLQRFKDKIAEKQRGRICKLDFIRDLHQMLADHVFTISMKKKKYDKQS